MSDTDLLSGESKFIGELGERLRQARKRNALSVRDVEVRLGEGFSRSSISLWEHGKVPVDVLKLYRLARLYGTSVVSLLVDNIDRAQLGQMVQAALLPESSDKPARPVPSARDMAATIQVVADAAAAAVHETAVQRPTGKAFRAPSPPADESGPSGAGRRKAAAAHAAPPMKRAKSAR